MLTAVTLGERLSTVTVVLSELVPPLLSVTVDVQVIMSVGIADVVERSKLAPVYVDTPTVHSTVGITVSSASVAVAVQVSTVSLYTELLGEIEREEITGSELETVIDASVKLPSM
jgi:hypothetical protein